MYVCTPTCAYVLIMNYYRHELAPTYIWRSKGNFMSVLDLCLIWDKVFCCWHCISQTSWTWASVRIPLPPSPAHPCKSAGITNMLLCPPPARPCKRVLGLLQTCCCAHLMHIHVRMLGLQIKVIEIWLSLSPVLLVSILLGWQIALGKYLIRKMKLFKLSFIEGSVRGCLVYGERWHHGDKYGAEQNSPPLSWGSRQK